MTARTLQRLARLEGRKDTLDSLSDEELDLTIGVLQRLVRREDGEIIPPHPDDEAGLKCLARIGIARGYRHQG